MWDTFRVSWTLGQSRQDPVDAGQKLNQPQAQRENDNPPEGLPLDPKEPAHPYRPRGDHRADKALQGKGRPIGSLNAPVGAANLPFEKAES